MATNDYWADAPIQRGQIALFAPTLDSAIAEDDPVRLFDEVLAGIDWSEWEGEYHGRIGQPPIHPRHVAAGILYGLYRRIRSSRQWEEATHYRLDFIWLLHGRRIDHTTFAKFRTKFRKPLKGLFRQIGQLAMTLGLVRLCEVGFDGTRVKANNARHATRTAKTLEEKLAALDELFEQMMAELDVNDATQKMLDGQADSPTRLPSPLADLERRRQQVRDALTQAQAADESRRKLGRNPEKNPAQVPTTDPDARVMPNKGGGYAPNYTPTVTTDGHRGFIVDCDVTDDVNEGSLAAPSVDRIEETFGVKPEKFLTDGGNNSGPVMDEMEKHSVEFFAPSNQINHKKAIPLGVTIQPNRLPNPIGRNCLATSKVSWTRLASCTMPTRMRITVRKDTPCRTNRTSLTNGGTSRSTAASIAAVRVTAVRWLPLVFQRQPHVAAPSLATSTKQFASARLPACRWSPLSNCSVGDHGLQKLRLES